MAHNSPLDTVSAGRPKVVLDLYEWLPPHGETSVSFHCQGLDLVVEISYDDESSEAAATLNKTIRFAGVCAFYVVASPGAEITRVQYSELRASGAVVEYTESEAARMWQDALAHRQKPIRHYQVFFLAENRRLEVFAEDCTSLE